MATVTSEPVAWRRMNPAQTSSTGVTDVKLFADQWQKSGDVVEALFTSEALAQARAEGKAEGMRDIATWHAGEQEAFERLAKSYHLQGNADAAQSALGIAVHHKISAHYVINALPSPPADGETKL